VKTKEKFDPVSMNGTYTFDGHSMQVQWYPGNEAYYTIIDRNPAFQGAMTLSKFKKFLQKSGAVKQ
jgi:hypothetical protein